MGDGRGAVHLRWRAACVALSRLPRSVLAGVAVNGPTGSISVTRLSDGLKWDWQGGIVAWISRELLEDAMDGVFGTRTPEVGQEFTVGPYTVRCTAHLISQNCIEVTRLS